MLRLGLGTLTLEQIEAASLGAPKCEVAAEAMPRIARSREAIEGLLRSGGIAYGVNTGFGRLSDYAIAPDQVTELQRNLVRSHACGCGNALSREETRALMILRANALALGFSGVRRELIELLAAMIERDVLPVIPEKGSVGASGDLAPLAHLALVLTGEGEAVYEGARVAGGAALERAGLKPVTLEAKEGLALLNGTQAINGVGALALKRALRCVEAATVAGAMTLEALRGTPVAFDERIQAVRPHAGQIWIARELLKLVNGSEIRASHLSGDPRVQDAYCLRCMPQVHGAVLDALGHARQVHEVESGSVTDNPLIFADGPGEAAILSGGNFHGAPLGLALDYAAIAVTDLASISERRIDRLINPDCSEGLPAFLTERPGVSSGFMIAHVAAVSLLAECKILAHPASVDNVPTSGGKEDHVSMGMTAALKFRTIVENAERVIATELLAAAQGLEFRRPLKSGAGIEAAHTAIRRRSGKLVEDRAFAREITAVASDVSRGVFALAE